MTDNARIVRDYIVASCPNPERLLAALTALETELATAKADLERAREDERERVIDFLGGPLETPYLVIHWDVETLERGACLSLDELRAALNGGSQ